MTLATVTLVLAAINVLLLFALIAVYAKNTYKMPTIFGGGLLLFGILFLIHNAMYLYFVATMMSYYAPGHEVFAFIFTLCQTAAFGVLNYLSWK